MVSLPPPPSLSLSLRFLPGRALRRHCVALSVLVGLLGTSGCRSDGIRLAKVPLDVAPAVADWDAGVVVPGSVTVVSFPLDDPLVMSADDVLAIASSCGCMTATAWDFCDDAGRQRVAVRVHILEKTEQSRPSSAARMLVLLSIKTQAGIVVERSVRVLLSRDDARDRGLATG